MPRVFIITVVIVLLGFENINSQNLVIPYSQKPTIDGNFQLNEWAKADSIEIEISSFKKTKVFFMHDSLKLYLAFVNNLQSGGNYFPEIVIDTDYDTATTFQSDDWWFHVSATDCEYQGEYGNYANCSLIRPNWIGVPNFTTGKIVDTVEVEIPMDSIGVSFYDTVGLGFLLNNFFGFKYYPTTVNHLKPNTFLAAEFEAPYLIGIKEYSLTESLKVFPSPSLGLLTIFFENQDRNEINLKIVNLSGQILHQEKLRSKAVKVKKQLDLSNYNPGIYFFILHSDNQSISKKIIIQ